MAADSPAISPPSPARGTLRRLGILGSGAGTNLTAIADECRAGNLAGEIVLVLSDVSHSGILERARERSLPCRYIAPGKYRSKLEESAERRFIAQLAEAGVDWVVLAGFMRIVRSEFLKAFPDRIVNIHPSLLPSFPGLNAPAQALESGVKVTGTTVHLVDQGIDTGAIIAQEPVRVEEGDTSETLHERIKQVENGLYPRVLHELITGRFRIVGRRVVRVAASERPAL